jgi:hypothetical protein
MQRSVFYREWSANERDIISIEEVVGDVRRNIRFPGVFGVASNINAPQCDFPSMRITKSMTLNV